jgi:putative membrane protein
MGSERSAEPVADHSDPDDERPGKPEAAVRDHLANERTLLAWQRTAIGIIAVGFLVDRLALDEGETTILASVTGIAIVVLGGIVSGAGAYRFVRTEREIDTETYRPAVMAHLLLTAAIVAGAVAVAAVLLSSLG